MTTKNSINSKQAAFAAEYQVDHNATQAAIRAGYSEKTAGQIGERLLKKAEIRRVIDAVREKLEAETLITAERVLRERARLAFSDPRKIIHEDGRVKLPHELDEDTAAAITSFKIDEYGRIEYRFAGKDPSLVALEKRLGLNEKPSHFRLPNATTAEDCARAQADIVRGAANGVLLPSEAETLARLIEQQRRSLETHDLAQRLVAIEEQLAIGNRP
jgi:phage terminase small subunit